VGDTGVGMSAEVAAHVFEPFFTTKERGRGTGLGLSTVYGIVRQNGGAIEVDSAPGRGTSFLIRLPLADGDTAQPEPEDTEAPPRGRETILLVEDELTVRSLAQRILERHGYRVIAASSGPEAMAECEARGVRCDLLLTDVVMPKMNGRELYERLRKMKPALKVLYMSGYTDNAIVHHGLIDAGTSFLGKPFTTADLTRKVREVLDSSST